MILLDTNVISELMKATPDVSVRAWIDAEPASALFVSAITQAEIFYGIAVLPAGKRRDLLALAARKAFEQHFAGRVLPFDSDAAELFAEVAASRRQASRPISLADAQIVAIARSRGATLATRNVSDFRDCGAQIVNPWDA